MAPARAAEEREVQRPGCPSHTCPTQCGSVTIPAGLETISQNLQNITITFEGPPEGLQSSTRVCPPQLYRTFHEKSVTLCSALGNGAGIHAENAFQSLRPGEVEKDLTNEAIERHLVHNQKKISSAWISCDSKLDSMKQRAEGCSRKATQVYVATIKTEGLIPATLHATCVSDWSITTEDKDEGKVKLHSSTPQSVAVPVWVQFDEVVPQGRFRFTLDQFMPHIKDLWISLRELRESTMVTQGPRKHSKRRLLLTDSHADEWLMLERIALTRIIGACSLYELRTIPDGATAGSEPAPVARSPALDNPVLAASNSTLADNSPIRAAGTRTQQTASYQAAQLQDTAYGGQPACAGRSQYGCSECEDWGCEDCMDLW